MATLSRSDRAPISSTVNAWPGIAILTVLGRRQDEFGAGDRLSFAKDESPGESLFRTGDPWLKGRLRDLAFIEPNSKRLFRTLLYNGLL